MLVNNAGLSPLSPSVDQVGEALFGKVIGVNLKGPFRLLAAIGTRMARGVGGSILNKRKRSAPTRCPCPTPYAPRSSGSVQADRR